MKAHERRTTKHCPACEQDLPTDAFSPQRRVRDGKVVVYLASACKVCQRARSKDARTKKPEHYLAKAREWKADNPQRNAEITAAWRADNQDHAAAYRAEYYRKHAEFLKAKARSRPADRGAAVAKGRAGPAAVAWGDQAQIVAMYATAQRLTQETGIRHDVDHLVPLKHPLVCGLHWEGNLQVLTASENAAKGARYVDDMI